MSSDPIKMLAGVGLLSVCCIFSSLLAGAMGGEKTPETPETPETTETETSTEFVDSILPEPTVNSGNHQINRITWFYRGTIISA
jgi:hypothetical protein